MLKVQTFRLLVAVFAVVAALFVIGCSKEKLHTVAEYLHDVDSARAAAKRYSNDPGKYEGNPDWKNASFALRQIEFLNDCFPNEVTTANTDHACLDKKGYTR